MILLSHIISIVSPVIIIDSFEFLSRNSTCRMTKDFLAGTDFYSKRIFLNRTGDKGWRNFFSSAKENHEAAAS